ncbi:MAG: polymer-forming cytoskeletal protein, partial [Desulfobacteraceae bacterium]
IIGENAVIDADVHVGVAIVRGKVNGRIEARQKIEIYAPAQVEGDISAPIITIDSGVIFNGKCEMQHEAKAIDPKSKPEPKPAEKAPEKAAS